MTHPFRINYFLFDPPLLLLDPLDDLELLPDELLLRLLPLEEERTLPEELLPEDEELDPETLLFLDDEELLPELDRTELDLVLVLVDFFTDEEFEEPASDDFFVDLLDLFMRTIFFPVVFDSGPVR
jgi:hypothetical protein